jgi:hypothetical protein
MQKGRNPRLIVLRNQYLIKRFYLLHEIERLRRDDCINILSEKEVFLDPDRIEDLLRQNYPLLKEIKRRKPTAKQLDGFLFEYVQPEALQQISMFG